MYKYFCLLEKKVAYKKAHHVNNTFAYLQKRWHIKNDEMMNECETKIFTQNKHGINSE